MRLIYCLWSPADRKSLTVYTTSCEGSVNYRLLKFELTLKNIANPKALQIHESNGFASQRTFIGMSNKKNIYWQQIEISDAAKHPKIKDSLLQQRIIWPKILIVLRVGDSSLE